MSSLLTVPQTSSNKRPGSQRLAGSSPGSHGAARKTTKGVPAADPSRNLKGGTARTNIVGRTGTTRSTLGHTEESKGSGTISSAQARNKAPKVKRL